MTKDDRKVIRDLYDALAKEPSEGLVSYPVYVGILADRIPSLLDALDDTEADRDKWKKQADAYYTLFKLWEKRAMAAEDDLNTARPCFACKHFKRNSGECFGGGQCSYKEDFPHIWEWCGEEKGGK